MGHTTLFVLHGAGARNISLGGGGRVKVAMDERTGYRS